jgi:hypothetical protein
MKSCDGNGFNPDVFGPPFWFVMHIVAHNFPVDHRATPATSRKYMRFYRSIGDVLPCRKCREHYRMHLKGATCREISLENFKDRDSIIRWVHGLHNCVNRHLSKPHYPLSKTMEYFETLRRRGRKSQVKAYLKRKRCTKKVA